jgi:uncharacterized repeat protein (TIGR03803 family)
LPRKSAFLAVAALILILGVQLAIAQETLLYSFSFNTAGTDGAAPVGNLVFDTTGNLYGATSSGGSSNDAGMIYELSPKSGGGWTEKILYAFTGQADGGAPLGSLIFDANGNLYGTAGGGAQAQGVVFELSPQSGGTWTEQVIYTFSGETDANAPNGGLIFDKSGNLYGTTESGGAYAAYGTVFELSPQSGGTWTEQILHSFDNNFVDGYRPLDSLIFDADGNLYGTTSYGGANAMGTVFELTPGTGAAWTEKILYSLGYGNTPYANLIFDSAGNLYSTTFSGGAKNSHALNGTVFELSPQTNGTWTEQILHSFAEDATDGGSLAAGLIFDAKGNLYSTTFHGGTYYTQNDTANTDGTIFELLPQPSEGWAEDVLYFFGSAANDGVLPAAGVIADAKGNLYGETGAGGAYGYGAVYEFTPVPTTALPVFSPDSGVYASAQTVTITDTTANATIYYTTDGSAPTTSSPVYSGPITVSTTETIQAIAVYTRLANSPVAWATYTIQPTAATPVISPAGGSYSTTQVVTITDATIGALIYYSTNGGAPATLYTGPISVTSSETITAMAVATGYSDSAIASATFTIGGTAAKPVFSPVAGTYTSAQSVTITDATSGATIYYTTDGSTPSASSTKYTGAIPVSSTETLQAIAVAAGDTNSPVATATYTIQIPSAVAPVFSPGAGTYTSAQSVTITDSTTGSAIYYTTGGTIPTASSTKYTGAISVNATEAIQAIAVATGYTNSAVASAAYTINPATANFSVAVSPSSLTISAGQSGTATISITPQNGFNSATTFSCSGLPSGASCSFSPASVTPSGTAAVTTSLTVSATASASILNQNSRPGFPGKFPPTTLAAVLCFIGFKWRRNRRFLLGVTAAAFLGATLLSGCGGSANQNKTTSAVNVIATSGATQQTVPLSVTIE